MELSQLSTKTKANAGEFLHLKHPESGALLYDNKDKSKPVGLILLGKDSDLFIKHNHKIVNERITEKNATTKTSEQIRDENTELLASLTTGWSNLSINGKSEFSRANVVELYDDLGLSWVREQADAFIGTRANFI